MKHAPELITETWLNADAPISLQNLRGKVVCLFAFQMLCPGCVQYLVPQSKKTFDYFADKGVQVLGLHTVFEHHQAMGIESLKAFIHEYRIVFPVGVDKASEDGNPIPETMGIYNMRGTPTTLLVDKKGYLRNNTFGHVDDMALGSEIATLLNEPE